MPKKKQNTVATTKPYTIEVNEKEIFKSLIRGDVQKHLKELSDAREYIEHLQAKLIESTWSEFWAVEHVIQTFWTCDKSPFGYCTYHKFEDRAWDHCLFCGEPYERK